MLSFIPIFTFIPGLLLKSLRLMFTSFLLMNFLKQGMAYSPVSLLIRQELMSLREGMRVDRGVICHFLFIQPPLLRPLHHLCRLDLKIETLNQYLLPQTIRHTFARGTIIIATLGNPGQGFQEF